MQTDTGVSRQLEAPTESAAPDFHQISTIPPHLKPSDKNIFISTLVNGISSTRPLPVPFTHNHLFTYRSFFGSIRTSWNTFVNPSVSWSTRKMSHCCSAIRDNISYHLTMTHTKTNTNKDKHKNKYKVLQRPNVFYIFEKHGVQGIQI